MLDEASHKGENVAVIGGGGKHELWIGKGGGNRFGKIRAGKVEELDLGRAFFAKGFSKGFDSFFRCGREKTVVE